MRGKVWREGKIREVRKMRHRNTDEYKVLKEKKNTNRKKERKYRASSLDTSWRTQKSLD